MAALQWLDGSRQGASRLFELRGPPGQKEAPLNMSLYNRVRNTALSRFTLVDSFSIRMAFRIQKNPVCGTHMEAERCYCLCSARNGKTSSNTPHDIFLDCS